MGSCIKNVKKNGFPTEKKKLSAECTIFKSKNKINKS
jgi:hypothetical protein